MGAAPALSQPAQRPRQRQQSCPGAAQGQTVTHCAVCDTELAAPVVADAEGCQRLSESRHQNDAA